jgi:hypothetical protein
MITAQLDKPMFKAFRKSRDCDLLFVSR